MPRQKIKSAVKKSLYTLFFVGATNVALASNISTTTDSSSVDVSTNAVTSANVASNNTVPPKQSSATDTSDADFNRFFINGAIGAGIANSNDGYSYNGGFAGMVNAGLNFNKTFAIEAGFTGTSSSPTGTVFNAAFGIPTLSYNLYDVAMRSTLHLSQYFSFYGKVGGAIEQATWTPGNFLNMSYQPGPNTNSFGALLGAGASVDLGHIGIFLEFDQYLAITGQDAATPANLSLLNLGLQYNF